MNKRSNQPSSSTSSFMYLFLLGFAIITLLSACSLNDDDNIKVVGSETWEKTSDVSILPTFLEDHTEHTKSLYGQVHEHAHILSMLDCYCGCMEGTAIDEAHSSLLRCYWVEHPADDGAVTWTDHSTTCGICKQELEMVIDLSNKGSTVEQIVQAVEDEFAHIIDTTHIH